MQGAKERDVSHLARKESFSSVNANLEKTVTLSQNETDLPFSAQSSRQVSEVFLVIDPNEGPADADNAKMQSRDPSQLESDLKKCQSLLSSPLQVQSIEDLIKSKENLHHHYHLFDDAFVPVYFTEEQANNIVEQMKSVKDDLQQRQSDLDSWISTLNQWQEEINGLSLWMKEVAAFLNAAKDSNEDVETLEAQVKEIDALQDDIKTLQPNFDNINDIGQTLLSNCDISYSNELQATLSNINQEWEAIVQDTETQTVKLKDSLARSKELVTLLGDINTFLDQLETELASTECSTVTAAPQLSQRTFKLMQLRDRANEKSEVLERISAFDSFGKMEAEIFAVQDRWYNVTGPVDSNYDRMKEATTVYGEFKTLVAQENDWLDRLEKKLRRSSKCAADAEEISEELDDLENCVNNHCSERLEKLEQLAALLTSEDVKISTVTAEVNQLKQKWKQLEVQSRRRIKSLENCITEAQEWECKILSVQVIIIKSETISQKINIHFLKDWLHEKDLTLTAHLEQELTVDDVHDEAQVTLRNACFSVKCLNSFPFFATNGPSALLTRMFCRKR